MSTIHSIILPADYDPELQAMVTAPSPEERERRQQQFMAEWKARDEARARLYCPPSGTNSGICRRFLAHNLGLTLPPLKGTRRLKPQAWSTARRMSYHFDLVFSYGTPIAAFHQDKQGKYLLVTSYKYSTSSGQHKTHLDRAVTWMRSYGNEGESLVLPVYFGPFIGAKGGWNMNDGSDIEATHRGNLDNRLANLKAMIESAKKGWRYLKPEFEDRWQRRWFVGDAISDGWNVRLSCAFDEAYAYAARFVPDATLPDLALTVADIEAHHQTKLAAFNHPRAVKARERAKLRKVARRLFCGEE